ncbi:arrestin domain-containing protein 3-like [Dendronephthya gigantea]|uniref:arrestin domain-containing protein 3-like n=1 Tax=Dendronephthya gigantea TaxID=151771 RepID=UPI00106C7C2E|nr:arrestin domain-containing protein 3-like [Dendronephthya gigantea]
MPRFDVNFADPKKFFYPGETIFGDIIVRVDSAVKCKKISLKFKGKSSVRWTTGSGDDRKTHWNNEEYFNNSVTLVTPLPPESEIILQPGDFHYPFQFQLPNNLPPSFEAPFTTGAVLYYMKIKIDVDSWRLKSDIEEKIPFKVVASPVDLNQTRNLLEPATVTEEKFLCCLCCQSGPIRLVGRIQKQAYYLGDQIIFSFEIDNKETDKPLRKIEARLTQKLTLISNTGCTSEDENAKSSVRLSEGLSPRGEESWHDVALNIPTDIIPSFDNCKCMHLEYYFIVNVDIEAAFDPKVLFPIKISSGPQMMQPGEPPFLPGNVLTAPGMGYPSSTTGVYPPPINPPPSLGYPPPTSHPQPAGYPSPAVTQQPTTWNPDQPPPPYPMEGKK